MIRSLIEASDSLGAFSAQKGRSAFAWIKHFAGPTMLEKANPSIEQADAI
ncbi:MAG: hypothetical protein JRN11_06325 [Nitrososphaerota archaeon]|nr:hypothetical protein [Nitrososphaerota archaeon]MDG7026347.1 hypothetical protein [Nitrososphaerota archaeon]